MDLILLNIDLNSKHGFKTIETIQRDISNFLSIKFSFNKEQLEKLRNSNILEFRKNRQGITFIRPTQNGLEKHFSKYYKVNKLLNREDPFKSGILKSLAHWFDDFFSPLSNMIYKVKELNIPGYFLERGTKWRESVVLFEKWNNPYKFTYFSVFLVHLLDPEQWSEREEERTIARKRINMIFKQANLALHKDNYLIPISKSELKSQIIKKRMRENNEMKEIIDDFINEDFNKVINKLKKSDPLSDILFNRFLHLFKERLGKGFESFEIRDDYAYIIWLLLIQINSFERAEKIFRLAYEFKDDPVGSRWSLIIKCHEILIILNYVWPDKLKIEDLVFENAKKDWNINIGALLKRNMPQIKKFRSIIESDSTKDVVIEEIRDKEILEKKLEEEPVPNVFISYSWDSKIHKDWVRKFGEDLVRNGVNIILDQWEVGLGEDLGKFMQDGIANANHILIICTPNYVQKANKRKGGVGMENNLIIGHTYFNQVKNEKRVIAIIKEKISGKNSVPDYFMSKLYLDLTNNDNYNKIIEELLRTFFNKPKHQKPDLGKPPF